MANCLTHSWTCCAHALCRVSVAMFHLRCSNIDSRYCCAAATAASYKSFALGAKVKLSPVVHGTLTAVSYKLNWSEPSSQVKSSDLRESSFASEVPLQHFLLKDIFMTPASGTSSATDSGSGDSINGCQPAHPCKPHCWTVRCVLIKALILVFLARIDFLLNDLILIYALFSICYQKLVPKCRENLVEDEMELRKLELDSLLPEVKGRILEHLDHEDIFKLKSVSKSWKALLESVEFIQALALEAKPVLTACSFFIDKGVWQWAAFDPKWNSTSGQKGKWRKLPPLTFLPPNCDPDPDLFKQFLFCANDGLVCMNFSKSPHEERLIVFNPLTEQWKELPPLLHQRNPVLMHMYADQSSKSYHILAAGSSASGEESLSRITELYDSRIGQWERVGDFPGPAFALNEYQSGIFQNGNIFCIGFLELGDQTVKGILGYNVEEGIWSTKWTAEALPNSTILQLVENNGDLFLFSERDNGPLIEHWVDRIEWTESEGDNENTTLKLVTVLKKIKSGGRSLEVYPEFALVPFSESQLCIYNTVDHSGEVFNIGDEEKCEALPALPEGFGGELGLFSLNPITFAIETQFSRKV